MSSYLITNYKGKYTLQAEIDKNTGDFCRGEDGQLDNYSDVWIECQGKCRIFHYGRDKLIFYCPSLGRGRNVLKSIYEIVVGSCNNITTTKVLDNGKENKTYDYYTLYSQLTENGIVSEIQETDEEVIFKFRAKDFEQLESALKPRNFCADRSPFSVKNLRKNAIKTNGKYVIPVEDLNEYKEITSVIPKGLIRIYTNMNEAFLGQITAKNNKAKSIETIKNACKISGMKWNEYYHANGYWDKYLKFAKEYIKNNVKVEE
jgi:hypothetical protein